MVNGNWNKLTWGLHAASLAAFVVFAVIGFIYLKSSNNIADNWDRDNKNTLVKNEVSRQVELMARDQSQISNWDDTLNAITGDVDKSFIRREIAGWLWEDFDIHDSIIVAPSGGAMVTVRRSKVLESKAGQLLVELNRGLVSATTELYFAGRKRTKNGFSFADDPVRPGSAIYAHEFRILDGKLGLFIAQAIVPSDGLTLAAGNPHVLLTHKLLSNSALSNIANKLGLSSFKIVRSDQSGEYEFSTPISQSGKFHAVWSAEVPSTAIWQSTRFLIFWAMFLLGGLLFLFSAIYSRALDQLEKNNASNAFAAFHDPLTGLPNRMSLDRTLSQPTKQKIHENAAILYMDLDRFKPINDTWGHETGDIVLQNVADRLNKIIGDRGIVARMGGDEFVAIVYDANDKHEVQRLSDEIVSAVSRPILIGELCIRVGISIGISQWCYKTQPASDVLRNADQALYLAKNSGRGRAEIVDFDKKRKEADRKKKLAAA